MKTVPTHLQEIGGRNGEKESLADYLDTDIESVSKRKHKDV